MSIFFRTERRTDVPAPGPFDNVNTLVSTVPEALRLIPLYAAVTGIADDISAAPWQEFTDSGDGWGSKSKTLPSILRDPSGTGVGFIPWMNQGVLSALLWGFAFGVVTAREGADGTGWPAVVQWIHPGRVNIDETNPNRSARFAVDGRFIPPEDVLYVPGPTLPGSVRGMSPVTLFRLQFGKQLAAQQFASNVFNSGVMPPGHLRNTAVSLSDGEGALAKARFKASVANRDIFVTGKDWEWKPLQVPDDDARFLETIKAGATEIAAISRVTPEDIGGVTGSSLTYSTLEMNQLNRNRRTLLPWVRRFESALTNIRPRPRYVRANLDALVRVDLKTRYEAHAVALKNALETLGEARALEDKPPLSAEQMNEWMSTFGPRAATAKTEAP